MDSFSRRVAEALSVAVLGSPPQQRLAMLFLQEAEESKETLPMDEQQLRIKEGDDESAMSGRMSEISRQRDNSFVSTLMMASSSEEFSPESRLLAVICLKNLVNRRWVQRQEEVLPLAEEVKHQLKEYVLSNAVLREENLKVSMQYSLLTAKIAKNEWNEQIWSPLEPLFRCVCSDDWTVCKNASQTLLQVLFALTSKKLLHSKKLLVGVAQSMLPSFSQMWATFSTQLLNFEIDNPSGEATNRICFQICSLTQLVCTHLKILQVLLMHSVSSTADISSDTSSLVLSILSDLLSQMKAYCGRLFKDHGGVDFDFQQDDLQAIGWSSVKDWEGEDDSTDATEVSTVFNCLNIAETTQSSPKLRAITNEAALQVALCVSVCQAKAMMAMAVIPLHLHADQKTRSCISSSVPVLLQQYHCTLLELFHNSDSPSKTSKCNPLAVVCTMFISNCFTQAEPFLPEHLSSVSSSKERKTHFQDLFDALINRLLRLSPGFMQCWEEDPEDLDMALQSSSEGDSLRFASEGLFASMMHHSPEEVTAMLLGVISNFDRQLACASLLHVDDTSDEVLYWEAVYVCCGLAAYHMSQSPHSGDIVEQWLVGVVGKLMTTPFSSSERSTRRPQVLRHRLLWLMSCWGYALSADMLRQLFGIVAAHLNPRDCDVMARLQAVRTLGVLMQCDQFCPDMILGVLEGILEHACHLVTADLCDSSSQAFVISFFQDVGDIIGHQCKPYLPTLLQHLGPLWGSSESIPSGADGDEDESSGAAMIRLSLLDLFTCLVNIDQGEAIDALSGCLEGPLSDATAASEESAHLCESGVGLWSALLRHSSTVSGPLEQLFHKRLPGIFSCDLLGADYTEMRSALSLLESYILLGGLEFVDKCGEEVSFVLLRTIGQVRPRAAPHALRPVEVLLLLASSSSREEAILEYLSASGVLRVLLSPCLAALSTLSVEISDGNALYCQLGAVFEKFQESDIALVSYLAVLARCLLMNMTFVVKFLGDMTGGLCSGEDVLRGLCRLMLDKFDTLGYSRGGIWRRRLCAFALLSVFPTSDEQLLSILPEVAYTVDGVMMEDASEEGQRQLACLASSIISIADDDDADFDQEPNEKCSLLLIFENKLRGDSVMVYSLVDVLKEKLECMSQDIGMDAVNRILSNVDRDTQSRLMSGGYSKHLA